jgi:hypothetical protein
MRQTVLIRLSLARALYYSYSPSYGHFPDCIATFTHPVYKYTVPYYTVLFIYIKVKAGSYESMKFV